jgi:hypothetical protein
MKVRGILTPSSGKANPAEKAILCIYSCEDSAQLCPHLHFTEKSPYFPYILASGCLCPSWHLNCSRYVYVLWIIEDERCQAWAKMSYTGSQIRSGSRSSHCSHRNYPGQMVGVHGWTTGRQWKPYYMCSASVIGGVRCREVLGHQAQCESAFRNGARQVCFSACGELISWHTTS